MGSVFGARSGDKGGNANLGVFARSDGAYVWLEAFLTVEKLRELLYKVDTDANGTLEFAEFCEFLRLAKSAEKSGGGGQHGPTPSCPHVVRQLSAMVLA